MNKEYCSGCRDNFYNGNNPYGVKKCWGLKTAKLVKRIPIGHWEKPPYLNKIKVIVPSCFHAGGIHYIDSKNINKNGYWR